MRRWLRRGIDCLILFCGGFSPASAQKSSHLWPGGIFYVYFTATDTRFMVRQPVVFSVRDDSVDDFVKYNTLPSTFTQWQPESPIMLGVHWTGYRVDPYATDVQSLTKTYHSYRMVDTSDGEVIALGITPANAADYRYHVVADDSLEIVPWSPVRLERRYGAKWPYGALGRYYLPGRTVLVEVADRKNYGIREGVLLDWKPLTTPHVTQVVAVSPSDRYWNLHSDKGEHYASRFDASSGLPLNLKFHLDSVDNFAFTMAPHPTVWYKIAIIHDRDTAVLDWGFLGERYTLESRYFAKPGWYTLVMQVRGDWALNDTRHGIRMDFEVLPRPQKEVPLKAAVIGLLAVGSIASVLLLRNRRMLKRTLRDRQLAGLRLKAIRSQLNPHFMVNALTSIQQLVSRNDIAGANRYLGTFAGLTRRVLMTGEEDRISLDDEAALLKDYLEMEQLRFGFGYAIDAAPDLDAANIEVPVMLLQPFVENAVKHGVSGKGSDGFIRVAFSRRRNDLLLTVTDNGRGFDPATHRQPPATHRPSPPGPRPPAYGLRLAHERIGLFNKLYRDAPADLDIDSDTNGTTVRITLKQWL